MRNNALYNPFYQVAGFKSLVIGSLVFLIVTSVAFKTGTHFNGLLNFDLAKDSGYLVFAAEHAINWLFTSLFMYISGLILSKSRIRLIDIAGTVLLARIPLIIMPLIRLLPVFQSFFAQSWQIYLLMGIYLFSLIWSLALLFNAFKISCNLKGERLIISFILSMILSEICTKTVISMIIY
jgi:hypothetical protein